MCETHPSFKHLILRAGGIKATPLVFTCLKGSLEMVKRVVEVWGADVNQAGIEVLCDQPFGWRRWFKEITPLFAAALKKKREIVNFLLEKVPNAAFRSNQTLLIVFTDITII